MLRRRIEISNSNWVGVLSVLTQGEVYLGSFEHFPFLIDGNQPTPLRETELDLDSRRAILGPIAHSSYMKFTFDH